MSSETLRFSAHPEIARQVRFNFAMGLLDGGFFGLAIGFASFVTLIPLFVSTLTDSAILIGFIPALHMIGWQLPQLLTAGSVSRLRRYKPLAVFMSVHERVPFFGLALVAWFSYSLNPTLALILVFILLAWQGLGGGLTATAWQSMIAKLIPNNQRGRFFGLQSATANLFGSVGALGAGYVLVRFSNPGNFALCFLIAGISMGISYFFLAIMREPSHELITDDARPQSVLGQSRQVLTRDRNFSWFILARNFAQFATAATAFFTIYAVRAFNISAEIAGIMTSVLLVTEVLANPIMGALGDKLGHRIILKLGILAALLAALLAWLAPSVEWFYLVFALAGVAGVGLWTVSIAMTLDFGAEHERPVYVGLANTLAAPATITAPIIGGWIADTFGFGMTFLFSVVCAVITIVILQFFVRDVEQPHRQSVAAD